MTAPRTSPLQVARVIWMALLVGVVGYFAALVAIAGAGGAAVDVPPALRTTLQALAAAQTAAVVVLRGRLAPLGAEPSPSPALTTYIICWALAEAVALYGMVLGLLERSLADGPPFFLASAALLLWLRPRA
jgi:hypothetical protein